MVLGKHALALDLAARCLPDDNSRLTDQGVKLRILARDWGSHRAIAHIAAILLQEELRYDVEVLEHTTLPFGALSATQDYRSIANGLFDANFEVWMSEDKEREYARWTSGTVGSVHVGDHRLLSDQGMWCPVYPGEALWNDAFFTKFYDPSVLAQHEATYREKGEEAGDPGSTYCLKPEWNCTDFVWRPPYCVEESECRAQLMKGPVGWYQGLLEQRIAANNLNISAVYTSWDDLTRHVWNAYSRGQKFLFYNFRPNAPIMGLPSSRFQRVHFPPRSPVCQEPSATPVNGTACEELPTPLQKIVSRKMASSTDASAFAKAFTLSQEDYDGIFEELHATRQDPRAAACRWLLRQGKQRYGTWAKHTKKPPPVPLEVSLSEGCWPAFWVQAGLFVASVLARLAWNFAYKRMVRKHDENEAMRRKARKEKQDDPKTWKEMRENAIFGKFSRSPACFFFDSKPGSGSKVHLEVAEALCQKVVGKLMLFCGLGSSAAEFRKMLNTNRLGFFSFNRSQEEFINKDDIVHFTVPNQGQGVFRSFYGESPLLQLIWHMLTGPMSKTIYRCIQFSLLVGAIGTFLKIVNENIRANFDESPWTTQAGETLSQIVSDFRSLPTLLLVFKVNALAKNWDTWLGYSGSIMGRLGDISLIVGALPGVRDERVRKVQFQFYRYLNALHASVYFRVDRRIPNSEFEFCHKLCRVGLLKPQEANRLLHSHGGSFDHVLLTWISILWHKEVEAGVEGNHPNSQNFMEKLQSLRTSIGNLRFGAEYLREPEVIDGMLYMVTYVLLLFVLVTYPFTFYSEDTGCFQPWSTISALLLFLTYDGLLGLIRVLQCSPYDIHGDCVNVDWLLCGMEQVIFFQIRAAYAAEEAEREEDKDGLSSMLAPPQPPASSIWKSVWTRPIVHEDQFAHIGVNEPIEVRSVDTSGRALNAPSP